LEPPILARRRRQRARVIEEARRWAQSLPGPLSAVLVGSYARGDFNAWSDVDVVLVSPRFRGLGVVERLRRVPAPPGYEVIPWAPEEFLEQLRRRNPLAVEAQTLGVVLRDDLGLFGRRRDGVGGPAPGGAQ